MARAMDPAARRLLIWNATRLTSDRALSQNSSMLDKAGQSLQHYADKLDTARVAAEALRRQQANLNTDPSEVTGSIRGTPMSLNQITGSTLSNVNTKELRRAVRGCGQGARRDGGVCKRASVLPLTRSRQSKAKLGAETAQYQRLAQAEHHHAG
jgi:hypothetical protein